MPRLQITLPRKILKNLENEAERRLSQAQMHGKIGRKLKGTVVKEIIQICIKEKFASVKRMTYAEFEEAVKELNKKRKKR